MKGFGIYVKNDLLEPKHYQNMGEAIWLYLWLLDKMTSVNENGVGKVLGNQPVTHELIAADLGIHRNTYGKYVKRLREAGYIQTLRTPYGMIITVTKATKIFKKRSTQPSASKELKQKHTNVGNSKSDAHDTVPKMHTKRGSDAHERVHEIKTIQDNTSDNTITTNVVSEPAKPDRRKPEINELFDYWAQVCQYNIESRIKQNRYAASSMLKKYGPEKLHRLIDGVSMAHSDQYAPQISDFVELQQKVTRLVAWGKKKHGVKTGGLKI